jgi:hypothetical protein
MSVKAEEWIELHPIRTMDDTFKTFAKDDGRKFVLEPMFEKLKLAAISGLASGTASGGGGAGRGCQRRLGFDGYSELTIRLDWWQMFRMKVARKQWVMYHQRQRNLCRRSVNVFC